MFSELPPSGVVWVFIRLVLQVIVVDYACLVCGLCRVVLVALIKVCLG